MPLELFERMREHEHEQVVFCTDRSTGLRAVIAIHDTTLGPALGGSRMWSYKSEAEAVRDVLRLSRGMTFKAAVAGLNLGGGKAVLLGDPRKDKTEAMFRSFGRFVHSLGGRYITAEDVGTSVDDMEWVRMETPYVTGISRALGGSGDPSPMTAWGVFVGMKACLKEVFGSEDLSGVRVAIQGLGHTGYWLASYLHDAGVRLLVSDLDEDRVRRVVEEFGAEAVAPDAICSVEAEIFAPAALGGVIDDESIGAMRFKIVAGSANNQLEDENRHGAMLREKGVLYAPDFVINSGGLINVANELEGYNRERAKRQVETVGGILEQIFAISRREEIPTHEAANRAAKQRIRDMARLHSFWLPRGEIKRKSARSARE